MTAFDTALVRAFLARTQLGERSPEYRDALEEMERERPVAIGTRCSRCARPGHTRRTCGNLTHGKAAA